MKWERAVLVWLLIIVAESIHGAARRLYLVPMIGERSASQFGVLVGSFLIFVIVWLSIRWLSVGSFRRHLQIGTRWVVLTVIFEFSLGSLQGYTSERILADYNVVKGGLMGLGLLFMLFAPTLAFRARGLRGYLF